MSTVEGALRLWTEIVKGLRAAGYSQVVPEYLKLSRMLSQARLTELVTGQPEAPYWGELRMLGCEALESLGPLADAAKILAELPLELQLSAAATAEPEALAAEQGNVEAAAEEAPVIATEEAIDVVEVAVAAPAEEKPKKRALRSKAKAKEGELVIAKKGKKPGNGPQSKKALSGYEN